MILEAVFLSTTKFLLQLRLGSYAKYVNEYIENTSWKVWAYGTYAGVVDVSEIERVSAAKE